MSVAPSESGACMTAQEVDEFRASIGEWLKAHVLGDPLAVKVPSTWRFKSSTTGQWWAIRTSLQAQAAPQKETKA